MATFKTVIKYIRSDGTATVYIRITHNRKIDYIETSLIARKKDIRNGEINSSFILARASVIINNYIDKLNSEDVSKWNVKDIVKFLINDNKEISFTDFFEEFTNRMIREGRKKPAANYTSAINSLKKFAQKDNFNFSDIKSKLIREWIEKGLKDKKRAKSLYPNAIQTVFTAGLKEYNNYDDDIIVIKNQPFMLVEIPEQEPGEKKAIERNALLKLFKVDVSTAKKIKTTPLSRDVAMLIFCLAGINTTDLYSMKKSEYRKGKFCYERDKTKDRRKDNAYIEITVPDRISPLIEKYKSENDMLFSFSTMYKSPNNFNKYVNKGLKELSELANIEKVTTYTFRHTWATFAQNKCGATDDEVGFSLNHSSSHTITKGYIKPDYLRIDRLNEKVLNYTFNRKRKIKTKFFQKKT